MNQSESLIELQAQPIFEEMLDFLELSLERLAPWLSDPVNGDDSFTIGSVLINLRNTLECISKRSLFQSLEEWVEHFKNRHASMGMMVTYNELGDTTPLCRVVQNELTCVLQEACGNAVKHGKAGMIQILVIYGEQNIKISIADNGLGVNIDKVEGGEVYGVGLKNMENRLKRIGGIVNLFNKETDSGAVILIEVPLRNTKHLAEATYSKRLGDELHDVFCPEIIAVALMFSQLQFKLSEQNAKLWYELKCVVEKFNEFALQFRTLSHRLSG